MNKLFLQLAIGIIVIFGLLIMGFCLWPRIAEVLRQPDQLKLIWQDGFERENLDPWSDHGLGYIRGCDVISRNPIIPYACISSEISSSGKRSAKMLDFAISRKLKVKPPLQIEMDVYLIENNPATFNSSTCGIIGIVYNCGEYIQMAHLFGPEAALFNLDDDYDDDYDRNIFYGKDRKWSHVIIRYEQDDEYWQVTFESEGRKAKSKDKPVKSFQHEWKNAAFFIYGYDGYLYIDNVRVYKVVR